MDCDDVSWKVNCRTWFVVKDENQMIVATFKYVQDAAKYVQDELVEVMDTWKSEPRTGAELSKFSIEAKYLPDLGQMLNQ